VEEKFTIDGREIILIYKTTVEERIKEITKEALLDVCSNEDVGKKFSVLYWIFIDKYPHETSIDLDAMENGKATVYLSPYYLTNKISRYQKKQAVLEMKLLFIHELTHLWQEFETRVLSRNQAIAKRLVKEIKAAQALAPPTVEQEAIGALRVMLREFLRRVFAEGIARYCEELQRGTIFSEDTFKELHIYATEEIEDIKRQISSNPVTTMRSIRDDLIIKSYPVGQHMVYSILYVDHDLKVDDIIKMEMFEFYRKYEGCILSKGFKPVITITSGRGELDYQRTLAELELAYKKAHR